MNWTELLRAEIEDTYHAAEGLLDLVDAETLDWKPTSGSNWMTTGQLIMHMTNACGSAVRGFVTGDWGMPQGDIPPDELLPPAAKMPTASSVGQAKALLAEDKTLALEMLDRCSEDQLANQMVAAPWNPAESALGRQLLQMIWHLGQHKAQLFYYLKLQGKPVHTGNLWGM